MEYVFRVEGKEITFPLLLMEINGTLYVPLRFLAEALGGEVTWDTVANQAIVRLKNCSLVVTPESDTAVLDGVSQKLRGPTLWQNGSLMISLTDLVELFQLQMKETRLIDLSLGQNQQTKPGPSFKVVVDPGHGGEDPGATGPGGTLEKNVNLAIARNLAERLRTAGIQVTLTRTADETVSLTKRAEISNHIRPDLFISIHANSFSHKEVQGTETYYKNESAKATAAAKMVQQELVRALGRPNRGVKTANFYVLRNNVVPAILTEIAFISNQEEERLLADANFQRRAAEAVYRGIARFFGWAF